MSTMNKILPLVMLMFVFLLFGTYATGILSSADDNMAVSDEYQDQYDNNVGIQNASLTLLIPISLLIGVMVLIVVVKGIRKSY